MILQAFFYGFILEYINWAWPMPAVGRPEMRRTTLARAASEIRRRQEVGAAAPSRVDLAGSFEDVFPRGVEGLKAI